MLTTIDGKVQDELDRVAVLISMDYSGWSTFNRNIDCLFSPEIVLWIAGGRIGCPPDVKTLFGDDFYGDISKITISWVLRGKEYIVQEYDGWEWLMFKEEIQWQAA